MSLYPAVDMLRRLAAEFREQQNSATGVSPAQLVAAKDVLSILSAAVLASLQAEQAANVLDWAAQVLEKAARDEETPAPHAPRPPG